MNGKKGTETKDRIDLRKDTTYQNIGIVRS